MRRSRRSLLERLFYAAAYRCERCQDRVLASYADYLRDARHAACPKCGWYDLSVFTRRDRIDRMNRNPLRMVQRLLGARLYHCAHCRLQFYDLRRLRVVKRQPNPRAHRAGA